MAPSRLRWHIKRYLGASRSQTPAAAATQSCNLLQNPASLYNLPPELLAGICQYLSLPDTVILSLVCKRFWNGRLKPNLFSREWALMQLRPSGPDLKYVRFYILRMLEHDGLLARDHPPKYCCWGCMKTHEKKAFRQEEFRKKPDLKLNTAGQRTYYRPSPILRYCSSSNRYMSFGCRGDLTFVELKYLLSLPHSRANDPYPRLIKLGEDRGFWKNTVFDRRDMVFRYTFCLGRVGDSRFFDMCKRLNITLCPHIRTGNRQVFDLDKSLNQYQVCRKCPTKFVVRIGELICVDVIRKVGNLLSATDPTWLAQSNVSYVYQDRHLDNHCRLFSDWEAVDIFGFGETFGNGKPKEFDHLL